MNSGVAPELFALLTSAPRSTSAMTLEVCPPHAASSVGVAPVALVTGRGSGGREVHDVAKSQGLQAAVSRGRKDN